MMHKPISMKSKPVLLLLISLATLIIITSGSFHFVSADPLHCDMQGWPSCYSVGYSNGLADPGTSCPSGHSDNYCAGWDAGARTENTQSIAGCGAGNDNSTCSSTQSQPQGGQSTTSTSIVGDTPMQDLGQNIPVISKIVGNKTTGVYHNENGIFIPWTTVCNAGQSYLNETCDSLINSDGSLTSQGDKAVSCIQSTHTIKNGRKNGRQELRV
jgi:hypothetical protein